MVLYYETIKYTYEKDKITAYASFVVFNAARLRAG